MYGVEKRSAILDNAADFARWEAYIYIYIYIYIYVQSHDKVTALGYVYTLGKQILRSPKRCTSQNATSAEFLDIQIPPCVLVYGWYL